MASATLPALQLVSKDELSPNASCAMCMNEVPQFAVRFICGHAIGVNCIDQWLSAGKHHTCPRCSYPFLEKRDDESVDSASGARLRSPSVARVDARSAIFGDQPDADRVVQCAGPGNASTDPPPNAPQATGDVYLPYRPPHQTPPSSDYDRTPSPSSQLTQRIPSDSHPPYRPSPTVETATEAARVTNKVPHNTFIPSDFGLPPSTVRPSLATLSSPSRYNQSSLPASLLAGSGRIIQTMNHSDLLAASPERAHANLLTSSRTAPPTHRPSIYIPYRPES